MSNEHADLNIEPIAAAGNATEALAELPNDSLAETSPGIEISEAKRALEAALMAASEPMPLNELKRLFDGQLSGEILRNLLDELRDEWAGRSVELALVASGYRYRVKPEYQKYLDKLTNDKPPKYSRAVLETLAIIAYRQPVTRADIEDIRGVQVSPHILKTLQDRGWIDEIGHKEVVGRPALFATTRHFLDDLNLRSLEELPPLHELQATLDMTQAGAALSAGGFNTLSGAIDERGGANPALPGIDAGNEVQRDAISPPESTSAPERPNAEATEIDDPNSEERRHG